MTGHHRARLSTALKDLKKIQRHATRADDKLKGVKRGYTSRAGKSKKARPKGAIEGIEESRRSAGDTGKGGQEISKSQEFSAGAT